MVKMGVADYVMENNFGSGIWISGSGIVTTVDCNFSQNSVLCKVISSPREDAPV